MDLSGYPMLQALLRTGQVERWRWILARDEHLLRHGREADAMRWLGLDPDLPRDQRRRAVRRAVRDALDAGLELPPELFAPRIQPVAVLAEGFTEIAFFPRSARGLDCRGIFGERAGAGVGAASPRRRQSTGDSVRSRSEKPLA